MPVVRIKNANSVVVIDERYSNLMLRQKLILNPTYRQAGKDYICSVDIGCSQDAVMAYRSNGGFSGIVNYVTQSGTVRHYDFVSYDNFSLEIYVYDTADYAALTGGAYLAVRNPTTGRKVFDSRGKYMSILGYMEVTAPINSGQFNTFDAGGRVAACVVLQPYKHDWAGGFDAGGTPVSEAGNDAMQIRASGNNIQARIEEWRYRTGGTGGLSYDLYTGSKLLMFVDVTGV